MTYDRIKLKKCNNFWNPPVIKKTEKVCKTNDMENRNMNTIYNFTEKSTVDLEKLMRFHLIEMCLPIFNINCEIRKVRKVDCFKMHETTLNGVSYVFIIGISFDGDSQPLPQPTIRLLKAILHGVIVQQRYSAPLFNIMSMP